jgi:hypothetical protein
MKPDLPDTVCAPFRAGGDLWPEKQDRLSLAARASDSSASILGVILKWGRANTHNQTTHGAFREAQRFLDVKLQQVPRVGRYSNHAILREKDGDADGRAFQRSDSEPLVPVLYVGDNYRRGSVPWREW